MDTKAIESFSLWARKRLEEEMRQRLYDLALNDDDRANNPPTAKAVRGNVLTETEQAQRARLHERVERIGAERLADEMAYTWFNRFAAIRYMEVNHYLPCRVRMFSNADDEFDPECLRQAANLDLPGLDCERMLRLIQAGDDEALYREILMAQCAELAESMPAVFGVLGGASALMLPKGLSLHEESNVLFRLVHDLPEAIWSDVEILGWMYQFYNAQRKAEFFKSKRKATPADIAPATQLFTPDWIVKYMVENSLGRLWMLNKPDSRLREQMAYYIEPDGEHEDFLHISGPEEITFCDPACGSGHILVYAFQLLLAMYEESGYRERDIPELILTKNLTGFEVDGRAGQLASLALTMCAREHNRRFFKRGVVPDIHVFENVTFEEDELAEESTLITGKHGSFVDALGHAEEVGSLLAPSDTELSALRADADTAQHAAESGDLFVARTANKLQSALNQCELLTHRFDVVVANPPYMGSSSFNPWMSKWIKKNYPDVKSDLCTCFIERGYGLAKDQGYAAMVTMQSWMFLGSFEKMRNRLIDEKSIVAMAHLGPRAFDAIGGEVVSVTADALYNGKMDAKGAYIRLADINGSEPKREKLLEAIANPDCGWFYQADVTTFHDIPGSPIAYWASEGLLNAIHNGTQLSNFGKTSKGIITGNNSLFIRYWWECSSESSNLSPCTIDELFQEEKWFPCTKGGQYRKWFGNADSVIRWHENGRHVFESAVENGNHAQDYDDALKFQPSFSWSAITSGMPSFRYTEHCLSEHAGMCEFAPKYQVKYLMALANSSVMFSFFALIASTLNINAGDINRLPVIICQFDKVDSLATKAINESKADWNSQETSWDFQHHNLTK